MKRIIFCFDGTWRRIDSIHPTNVVLIAQSISHYDHSGQAQTVHYDEGVGTTATDRWTGGIFGHGLLGKMVRAYHFLVLNYEPGDKIYVFGFSRGAFAARSFVGLLRNCGIISRQSLEHIRDAVDLYQSRDKDPYSDVACQFRYKHCPDLYLQGDLEWREKVYPDKDHSGLTELCVEYLGIWDSVGALGFPKHVKLLSWLTKHKYQFHDTKLSSFVRRARHAVAADEERRTFEPGLWSNLDDLNTRHGGSRRYEQMIFPGVHSAIGGGGKSRGLSDAALEWVFEGAVQEGLVFDDLSPVTDLHPDYRAPLFPQEGKSGWSAWEHVTSLGIKARKFSEKDVQTISNSLILRYNAPADELPEKKIYKPKSLENILT